MKIYLNILIFILLFSNSLTSYSADQNKEHDAAIREMLIAMKAPEIGYSAFMQSYLVQIKKTPEIEDTLSCLIKEFNLEFFTNKLIAIGKKGDRFN